MSMGCDLGGAWRRSRPSRRRPSESQPARAFRRHRGVTRAPLPPAGSSQGVVQGLGGYLPRAMTTNWRACTLACGLALTVFAAGCGGTLDRDAVQTDLGAAGSAAAEGELLALQAGHGSTAKQFVSLHSAELHKVAQNAHNALVEHDIEAPYRQAAKHGSVLALRAKIQLELLHNDPGNGPLALKIADRLGKLSDALGKIEESL